MAASAGELKARWSKRERDVLMEWGGVGADKSDGSWLHSWLSYHKGFDGTFLAELDRRGYDVTTLRISVKRKTER
jgi:hypothetical protein